MRKTLINSPFIQIAGIHDQDEADLLIECGVKYLGFPLRLPVHQEDLAEEDAARIIENLPDDVEGVLITYLSNAEDIIAFCDFLGVHVVQLHGDIELKEIAKIRRERTEIIIIKSLVVGKYSHNQIIAFIEKSRSLVDAYITDTYDPVTGADGATGNVHDWSISRDIVKHSNKPVILAGGLNDQNVESAIRLVCPIGVDSHTGVEGENGRKDPDKVKRFVDRAYSALQTITISFPDLVDIHALERTLDSAFQGRDCRIGSVIFDLSGCRYISVSSLIYILSILDWRSRNSLRTRFILPKNKKVRDFLRLWGFPEAVFEYTGYPFSHFCTSSDINDYFGENDNSKFSYYNARSYLQNLLINERFFAICTYPISEYEDRNVISRKESTRWRGDLIREYLKRNLDGHSGASYVSSRIVIEAMTNAIRHPGATLISATSFCANRSEDQESNLTITFWDNGKSMINTISSPVMLGENVRIDLPLESHFCFNVDLVMGNSNIRTYKKSSSEDVSGYFDEQDFLLACMFPGVSRDVARRTYVDPKNISLENDGLVDNGPGHGLSDLLNCACDIFNGSVTFITGRFKARVISAGHTDNCRYKVTMTKRPDDAPKFNGNMLIVDLPIEPSR